MEFPRLKKKFKGLLSSVERVVGTSKKIFPRRTPPVFDELLARQFRRRCRGPARRSQCFTTERLIDRPVGRVGLHARPRLVKRFRLRARYRPLDHRQPELGGAGRKLVEAAAR